MTFHAVVPAPLTILENIFKVPPASLLIIDQNNHRNATTYWCASYIPNQHKPYEELKDELIYLLAQSVERRCIADVPVGVLLSGGIDSSLIVALLAYSGKSHIKTFSIGFEDIEDEEGNEFYYSDLISNHFATDHQKIYIRSTKLLDSLEDCVTTMSEPMVSHDNIGFFLLSQKICKHIKVVQSGQGADEIFGGYMWYPPLMESNNALEDYTRVFFDISHSEFCQAICSHNVFEDFSRQFVKRHFQQKGAQEAIDKALRLDTTVMLVEDPLKRVDNMTMAWGLEARVPFLDHEIVEYAAKTPSDWKIYNGIGKYILKEAARKFLPAQVIDRPKRPFPVPALKYIQGPYLDMVRTVLESNACRTRNIFRQDYIRTLLESPLRHMTPLKMSKLWQIAMLEFWCQLHLD
ncbi:MAG: N-acetylglutaminylglutamine amidotransferase [bacterium]